MTTLSAIIIPALSEERNLSILLPRLRKEFPGSRIIVITSSSENGTLRKKFPFAQVLSCDSGFGPSVLLGLQSAKGPALVLDGDLSHSPADAKQLWEIFRKTRPALLIGSRYCPGGKISGWSQFRRFLSASANRIAGQLLGTGIRDLTSGFRIYSGEAAAFLAGKKLPTEAYPFQLSSTVILERASFRVEEQPIVFRERKFGRSKTFSLKAVVSFLLRVVKLAFT